MRIVHKWTCAECASGEQGLHTQPTDLIAQLTYTASPIQAKTDWPIGYGRTGALGGQRPFAAMASRDSAQIRLRNAYVNRRNGIRRAAMRDKNALHYSLLG